MEQFENLTLDETWAQLRDVPVNEDMELDEDFLSYPIGTDVTEIWHDIEEHYDITLGDYMYGNT